MHTTIEDALSHRTGMPRHDLIYGVSGDTPAAIVARLRSLPMTAQPRTAFQYCNLMYAVLTDFLETVTGLKLELLLQERFWDPLGMRSTSFTLTMDKSESKLARGYFWDSKVEEYFTEPYLDLMPISGAGATISTVNDYALWIKALLSAANPGLGANHSSPLTPAMFYDLVSPRTIISDPHFLSSTDPWAFTNPFLYALGWITMKVGRETIIAHQGSLTGFGTAVYLLPEHGFGIAMMGNTENTSNLAEGTLSSVLMKRKLGIAGVTDGAECESAELVNLEGILHGASRATLSNGDINRPSVDLPNRDDVLYTASLPLPGVIADFAGLYTHPAYGTLDFTVINTTASSTPSQILRAIVAPRVWPRKLELQHTTDTVFALTISAPHGMGEDLRWEVVEGEESARRAIFKFGLDGETVETMGIELEGKMVERARGMGEKAWKEGMVWFEKR